LNLEDFTPQNLFIINDLETLRVMADPLRTQIYEILLQAPASVSQVADRLGLAPSRLYYHVNRMEKLGLLRVVETRMVANIVEKFYRSVAVALDVSPELLNFSTDEGKEAITELVVSGLDATREDIMRSFQARLFNLEHGEQEKQRSVNLSRVTARVSDAYAEEFHARLRALIEEFQGQDLRPAQGEEQGQNYALLIAFYPSFYYKENEAPDQP
jgi:DNA-binding transcriptional ArsR family regulator